jgi:GNAT superfamily N-acetyltransferase
MAELRIVDVTDATTFALIPPCADARFDHRTCDYWEDAERGTKAARASWLRAAESVAPARPTLADNPFAPEKTGADFNPFDPRAGETFDVDDNPFAPPSDNPFAPTTRREQPLRAGVAPKLALLDRGRGVFGSYAKVMLADEDPVAYSQFGPLSAYPRGARLRDLYPQLPASPLPAVITCIASTAEARRQGYAQRLVQAVCDDLAERGFAAIEAYPDLTRDDDETSAGRPPFWHSVGFETAVDDERFPVMRRELN